jgi:hypothetical protein
MASAANPWPEVRDEDRWAIELMEDRLENTRQSPAELRARAVDLRAEAQQTDMIGIRDAALALAERYEQAAAARTAKL